MPIEDVARLMAQWRGARTPTEQVRVITAAARTLRSLSEADRRVLTSALVEGGAGEAAARLDASESRVPSTADLTSFAQALRTVPPGQLEAIAATLSDPAQRRRLAANAEGSGRELARAAWEVLPPPPVPPSPSAPVPPPAGPGTAPTGPAVALPPPATPAAEPEPATHTPEPDPATPAPEPSAPAPEPAATEAGERVEAGTDDTSWSETDTEAVLAAAADHRPTSGASVATRTAPVMPADVPATLAAIAAATTPQGRLRAVADLEGAAIRTDDLVAVLRALPDGWQRRAAARRLLTSCPLADVDAEQVIESFARDSDRTAVAALLVSDAHAHVETVTDHLDARAADRLRRRAASRG